MQMVGLTYNENVLVMILMIERHLKQIFFEFTMTDPFFLQHLFMCIPLCKDVFIKIMKNGRKKIYPGLDLP